MVANCLATWEACSQDAMRVLGHRCFFYSLEGMEAPHVHVERDQTAKFWLDPVRLAGSRGFRPTELNRIRALVIEHRETFKEAWRGHFGAED
jgi:hypothetical protein